MLCEAAGESEAKTVDRGSEMQSIVSLKKLNRVTGGREGRRREGRGGEKSFVLAVFPRFPRGFSFSLLSPHLPRGKTWQKIK